VVKPSEQTQPKSNQELPKDATPLQKALFEAEGEIFDPIPGMYEGDPNLAPTEPPRNPRVRYTCQIDASGDICELKENIGEETGLEWDNSHSHFMIYSPENESTSKQLFNEGYNTQSKDLPFKNVLERDVRMFESCSPDFQTFDYQATYTCKIQ